MTTPDESTGYAQITDIIDRLGVPGSYRVRLYDRQSGQLLRETLSDENGVYCFDDIALRTGVYFIVAHDDSGSPVNGAMSDYVSSEMPSRYIPQFGGLASGAFDTPIVLSEDFEIEVVVDPAVSSQGRMILSGTDEIYLSSISEVVWIRNGDGMGNLTFSHPLSAGQISTLSLKRVGSTLTATVNGVERDSITLTDSVSFSYLGARDGNMGFYTGHILSLKILDRATPSNSQTFDFSSSSTASDQNRDRLMS